MILPAIPPGSRGPLRRRSRRSARSRLCLRAPPTFSPCLFPSARHQGDGAGARAGVSADVGHVGAAAGAPSEAQVRLGAAPSVVSPDGRWRADAVHVQGGVTCADVIRGGFPEPCVGVSMVMEARAWWGQGGGMPGPSITCPREYGRGDSPVSVLFFSPSLDPSALRGSYHLSEGDSQRGVMRSSPPCPLPPCADKTPPGSSRADSGDADAEVSKSRVSLLRLSTVSADMRSFLYENPGAVLADFVRWYSPPNWQVIDAMGSLRRLRLHRSRRVFGSGSLDGSPWETVDVLGEVRGAWGRRSMRYRSGLLCVSPSLVSVLLVPARVESLTGIGDR